MKLNHELYQKTSGEKNVQGKQIDPNRTTQVLIEAMMEQQGFIDKLIQSLARLQA